MQEPRKIVLILGNGFDLDLGLKTSYKDFWESEYCPKDYPAPLIYHLNQCWPDNRDSVKWYDLENELYYYCKRMEPATPRIDVITNEERVLIEKATPYLIACGILQDYPDQANSLLAKSIIIEDHNYLHRYKIPYREDLLLSPEQRDREALNRIRIGLCKYISQLNGPQNENKSSAHYVLSGVLNSVNEKEDSFTSIYSFNYTPLLRNGYIVDEVPVFHVHGDCETGKIIIGSRDDLTLDKDYDFVIKSYDPAFAPPGLVNDLQIADEIIIYGHSIGINDRQYFESFFSQQASNTNQSPKKITIFTKDNLSELEIKRALQVMTGGNLASLYSISQPKIIKIDSLKQGEREAQNLFLSFLTSHGYNERDAAEIIGKLCHN